MVANLVLQDAIERIFVGDIYGDIYAGIYVIRGENVVLLGEIVLPLRFRKCCGWNLTIAQDLDKEDDELPQRRVSGQEAQEAFNREIEQRKRKERSQNRVLHGMVCSPHPRTPTSRFWMGLTLKGFSVNDWTLEEMNLY